MKSRQIIESNKFGVAFFHSLTTSSTISTCSIDSCASLSNAMHSALLTAFLIYQWHQQFCTYYQETKKDANLPPIHRTFREAIELLFADCVGSLRCLAKERLPDRFTRIESQILIVYGEMNST